MAEIVKVIGVLFSIGWIALTAKVIAQIAEIMTEPVLGNVSEAMVLILVLSIFPPLLAGQFRIVLDVTQTHIQDFRHLPFGDCQLKFKIAKIWSGSVIQQAVLN